MTGDVRGPVIGNRRHNLVMHDQYMKKYEEMQKTFSHRSLQLQREERELDKKLEAIVGRNDSFTLKKTIGGLEPLPPREASSRNTARSRTPFPRNPANNFIIPSPPKGRPKSTVRGRRPSISNELFETQSEGRASPIRQQSPERGQPSVTGEDGEKIKRRAALSRRRNTVCPGVLTVQLEQLNKQRSVLLKVKDFKEQREKEVVANQENEDNIITEESDSKNEVKEDESDKFKEAEQSVSNTVISKPKNLSAIFCYKYEGEEGEEEMENKSVLVNSKPVSTEPGNTMASNGSAPTDNVNVHQNFSKLQLNSNSKVCRKISVMSPVQEKCDGFEEESNEHDDGAKEDADEQGNKISSGESVSSNNLNFHQNHSKSQQNGNSKFGRKISVMSPVQESEWAEENPNDTNDDNEKCICEVQSVNESLPEGLADSKTDSSQTISLAFPVTNTSSSDNGGNSPKGRIVSKTDEWPKSRPTSNLMQRGRSPERRLSRSLEPSASPPSGNARLMHRRRSLDPNMLSDLKQFSNVQRKPEQRPMPFSARRRRGSVCDPSFQSIDMVGVDVGREKFKSIARKMLALSRGQQKDESDDADNKDDVSPEWKDIDKCRYLRSYVPKWDRA